MGNHNSTSSGGGVQSAKHNRQRQLEKSASCGIIESQCLQNQTRVRVDSSGLPLQPAKDNDTTYSIVTLEEYNNSLAQSQLNDKYNNKHHYNVHKPSDLLLGLKASSVGGKNNCSLVKRNSSALEFLSTKSPLSGLIKGKLGKGSYNNLEDCQSGHIVDSGYNSFNGSTANSERGLKSSGQKMSCNLDKFAKLLAQLSGFQKQGLISHEIFEKHLTVHSPVLTNYLWNFFGNQNATDTIPTSSFINAAENLYAQITDKDQITFYLKVFGPKKDIVEREAFFEFLISAYQLSTVGSTECQTAFEMSKSEDFDGKEWIESVAKACYHIKDEMSVCFLSNWLLTNLPRFHQQLHKYILHQLTTGYTQMTTGSKTVNIPSSGVTAILDGRNHIQEHAEEYKTDTSDKDDSTKLNPILMWLLRSSLPNKYLTIFERKPEPPPSQSHLNSAQLIMQMLHINSEPEKWSLLYDSDSDGLSINRFQFHVFNYRGPTMMIVTADNGYSAAIASDSEWKESCHFWGGEDTVLLQLQPEFRIVERGAKMLYANFSIRGYPFGIQAGKDPRNVSLEIKPDFSYAHFKKIPCRISKFVVWGCAPKQAQVSQTDFKKWEARQCENIRKVNINSAEWKENPDKYLLELAGGYRSYDN